MREQSNDVVIIGFRCNTPQILAESINKFLLEHPNLKYKDIKYSSGYTRETQNFHDALLICRSIHE